MGGGKFKVGDTISLIGSNDVEFVWNEGSMIIGLVKTEEELRVYTSPMRGHHIVIIEPSSYCWTRTILTERCRLKLFNSDRRLIYDKSIITIE